MHDGARATTLTIEPVASGEIEELSRLVVSAVRKGFSKVYAPDVVEAIVGGNSVEAIRNHAPKQTDYAVHADNRIVGMIGLKRNEVGHLFVLPEESRKGVGRMLLDFARKAFRDAGYSDMTVLASLNAVGFYERCGFNEQARGDFGVGNGLRLDYVKMTRTTEEKPLMK